MITNTEVSTIACRNITTGFQVSHLSLLKFTLLFVC